MEKNEVGWSEDWLAVVIGLFIFVLSLGVLGGVDILGWGIKTNVWVNIGKALEPISKGWASVGGIGALILTYLFLLVVMTIGASALKTNMARFAVGFTFVFWVCYACWLLGSHANIAATPDKLKAFGITWSLNLTQEAGFIIALIVGLIIGNLFPGFTESIKDAVRPELYIKTAIVILGGALGATAAEQLGLATSVMFRGLCAIVEAYLIYWAIVYYVSRKYFGFSKEWAAPLASGISICGVSAAIATGGAIKARPVVPIMVSSLVVIFAVVELLILPFLAQNFLWKEPMVAGAWMGLAVKTDGAAVASGAITDSLIRAKALAEAGINYKPDWIMGAATTVKVFIDIFIGVWAFVLAIIWCSVIECKPGERVRPGQIWERFPKFVLGYVVTFIIILWIGISYPHLLGKAKAATGEANVLRVMFFMFTFLTIGMVSNFRKLWEEGIGRLAAVYLLCLFGFIIWIGLIISWIFFHGVKPPVV
ncbi:MAG: putative sulfate exporter family transporter [Desulfomonilaceae bacterium]